MEDISIITFHGVNENSEQPQKPTKDLCSFRNCRDCAKSPAPNWSQHPFEETIQLDVGRKASTKDDENVITNEKAATI